MSSSHHHHDHHGHGHHHDHAGDASGRRLKLALMLTAGFMLVELIAGFWSGSLALVADAGHMLTDAASLALALYASMISRRAPDDRRTYGYGRARVLAAFVNGLSLLLISVWIVIEAVQRLRAPVSIQASPMLVVATAGLLVNILAYLILRGGNDINSRGALAHVLGDLLGSVAAIAAALVILTTGWTPADPLLSVLVALLILRTGWQISRESAHTLLEGSPEGFDAGHLRERILDGVPDALDVHHIHAWTVAADHAFITLHVRSRPETRPDLVVAQVRTLLAEAFDYQHVTVQVEHDACGEEAGRHSCAGQPAARR